MGIAVKDPSHGSDAGFIRDLNGNMHVIIEDWSPISANKRSWDSPLAGHAVSPNGISGFKFRQPAVDNRTKPTGEIGTYKHPHWAKEDPKNFKTNVAQYNIHQPEQEAYGDWAANLHRWSVLPFRRLRSSRRSPDERGLVYFALA